jgi:hypothetical protein
VEEARQHSAVNLSALGNLHLLLWGASYLALAGAVVLTITKSPWGLWVGVLWFVLVILRAALNVFAGLKAGVVFRMGNSVTRQADTFYYVFMFGLSAFLVGVAAFLGLFVAAYKLLT